MVRLKGITAIPATNKVSGVKMDMGQVTDPVTVAAHISKKGTENHMAVVRRRNISSHMSFANEFKSSFTLVRVTTGLDLYGLIGSSVTVISGYAWNWKCKRATE